MKLSSAKKCLRIIGTLILIGAVISILFGVFMTFLGGAGTTMPDIEKDEEMVKGVAVLLGGGIGIIIAGIFSFIEGLVTISAGKTGRHTMAALVFAVIGVILGVALNVLTLVAVLAVRKAAKKA